MTHRHKVHAKEIGLVRIYVTQGERRRKPGIRGWLSSKPLYTELINAAKRDGVPHAVAHFSHCGYTNSGGVEGQGGDAPNPKLNMYVELIGPREKLEDFCRKHGDILKGKHIVYKHMEHWEIAHDEVLQSDASPSELRKDQAAP